MHEFECKNGEIPFDSFDQKMFWAKKKKTDDTLVCVCVFVREKIIRIYHLSLILGKRDVRRRYMGKHRTAAFPIAVMVRLTHSRHHKYYFRNINWIVKKKENTLATHTTNMHPTFSIKRMCFSHNSLIPFCIKSCRT